MIGFSSIAQNKNDILLSSIDSIIVKVEAINDILRSDSTNESKIFRGDSISLYHQLKNLSTLINLHERNPVLIDFYKRINRIQDSLFALLRNEIYSHTAFFITSCYNEILLYQTELLSFRNEILARKTQYRIDSLLEVQKDIRFSIDSCLTILKNYNSNIRILKLYDTVVIKSIDSIIERHYDSLTIRQIDSVKEIVLNIINQQASVSLKNCACDSRSSSTFNYISVGGFVNSLYSVSYYHQIYKNADLKITVGPEIIIPTENKYASNIGAFINSGILKKDMVFDFGIGILNVKQESTNISWKVGLCYLITKIGLGISYSPLTGFGASIGLRFN